jgi:hypothetical protein
MGCFWLLFVCFGFFVNKGLWTCIAFPSIGQNNNGLIDNANIALLAIIC